MGPAGRGYPTVSCTTDAAHFCPGYKVLRHSVRVSGKADADVQLRVRLSERIVVQAVYVRIIENVYARRPRDAR